MCTADLSSIEEIESSTPTPRMDREVNGVTIMEDILTFPASQLEPNHHYNLTVRARNVAGSATSYTNISNNYALVYYITFRLKLHSLLCRYI